MIGSSTATHSRRHSQRFDCEQAASWSAMTRTTAGGSSWPGRTCPQPEHGRWARLDEPPIGSGTVIRVQVEPLPKPTGRAPKTLWRWGSAPGQPDLDLC
jgi:hypothetical protein